MSGTCNGRRRSRTAAEGALGAPVAAGISGFETTRLRHNPLASGIRAMSFGLGYPPSGVFYELPHPPMKLT